MANEFITKNGFISLNDSRVNGSLTVTNGVTASLQGTASIANRSISASYAPIEPAFSSSIVSLSGSIASRKQDLIATGTTLSITASAVSGSVNSTNRMTVWGASVTSSLLQSNGVLTVNAHNTAQLAIGSNPNTPFNFYIQAKNRNNNGVTVYPLALNPNGGGVGIGTEEPVNRLDVVGNISASVVTASLLAGTSSFATNAKQAVTSSYHIGVRGKVVTFNALSGTYQATSDDYSIFVSTNSVTGSVFLPPNAEEGRIVIVKKTTSDTNLIKVAGSGSSSNIDGASQVSSSRAYATWTFQYVKEGSTPGWFVIATNT